MEVRQSVNAAQLINQDSGKQEYGTPGYIMERVRATMGPIDFDPATIVKFNETVGARTFCTGPKPIELPHKWGGLPVFAYEDRGALDLPHWRAKTLWMNHPFSPGWKACDENCTRKTCRKRGYHIASDMPSNADWVNRFIRAYEDREAETAMCITYMSTAAWLRPLKQYYFCLPHKRVNYNDENGEPTSGVTKGSVIFLLTRSDTVLRNFTQAFSDIGSCHELLGV